jgi:hypothetical protein
MADCGRKKIRKSFCLFDLRDCEKFHIFSASRAEMSAGDGNRKPAFAASLGHSDEWMPEWLL